MFLALVLGCVLGHWPPGVLPGLTDYLGVSQWECLCPPPAAGCEHSGDIGPLPGIRERFQRSRHSMEAFIWGLGLEMDLTHFCLHGASWEGWASQLTLARKAVLNGFPTLSPACSTCLPVLAVSGKGQGDPGLQDSKPTWPRLLPYHTPKSPSNPSSRAGRSR
jgi:hypothetical protein